MKMTYSDALDFAIVVAKSMEQTEQTVTAIEKLTALQESLTKRAVRSDEAKEKASAKRKEKSAKERAALMEKVLPVLRDTLSKYKMGITAKELYTACAENLPADFTTNKVQYILLHEMAVDVFKIEQKGKPNIYKMQG